MVYFGRRDPLLAISEIAVPFAAHLFPAGTFCCARMVRGLSLCGISYVRNLGGLEIMMKTCCDLYSPFVAQIRGKSSRSYWRTATSLILAAKRELSVPYKSQLAPTGKLDRGDYDVLMLTRSKKSAFMSERVVFPGGVLDEEDFHENWKDIFEKCTSKEFGELESAFTIPGIRPPVILSHCEGCLSPDIAFRIGAIRETFEETGILLVKSKSELAPGGVFLDKMSNLVVKPQDILKSAELKSWRETAFVSILQSFKNFARNLRLCQMCGPWKNGPTGWHLLCRQRRNLQPNLTGLMQCFISVVWMGLHWPVLTSEKCLHPRWAFSHPPPPHRASVVGIFETPKKPQKWPGPRIKLWRRTCCRETNVRRQLYT